MEPLVARIEQPHQSQSRVLYAIWFAFSPMPLHALTACIDIATLTNRCCPRLPGYLSYTARGSIIAIALLTYTNAFAVVGFSSSAFFVWNAFSTLEAHMVALNETLPDVTRVSSPGVGQSGQAQGSGSIPPLLALWFWMRFTYAVMIMRTVIRTIINSSVRTRGLPVTEMARVEYSVDLVMWTSFMALCILKLSQTVRLIDGDLVANGLTPLQSSFAIVWIHIFIDSWLADVVMRLLWMYISWRLDHDFRESKVFRLVALLPQTEEAVECSVCLSGNDEERCRMPCGHTFHRACMLSWVRSSPNSDAVSCPLCRSDVTSLGYN